MAEMDTRKTGSNSVQEEPFMEITDCNDFHKIFDGLEPKEADKAFQVQQCAMISEAFGPIMQTTSRFYKPRNPHLKMALCVTEYPCGKDVVTLQEVAIYCHSKDLQHFQNHLSQTEVIEFRKFVIYLGNDCELSAALEHSAKLRGGQLLDWDSSSILALDPRKALDFELGWHDDVYCRPLQQKEASIAYNRWKYRATVAYDAFQDQVARLPSTGVFLKNSDQLVSWIIVNKWGAMSYMYTLKEHRRRGYGGLAAKFLSQQVAKRGMIPFVCIEDYNEASLTCFTGLGFELVSRGRVLCYVPDDAPPQMKDLDQFFKSDHQEE